MKIWHDAVRLTPHIETHLSHLGYSNYKTLGWGKKPISKWIKYASYLISFGKYAALEDGFISYFGHPVNGDKRSSLIIDDIGIYYDATSPSKLENLCIESHKKMSKEDVQEARYLINTIKIYGISKYNLPGQPFTAEDGHPEKRVLLVDQVEGDMSLQLGFASDLTATEMYDYAKEVSGGLPVYLKIHPDIILKKKNRSSLLSSLPESALKESIIVPSDANTFDVLKEMTDVVVATSQLGFEALLTGADVHCLGVPFYSHYGLTIDSKPQISVLDRRLRKIERGNFLLEHLFDAAYNKYCSYIDLDTGSVIDINEQLNKMITYKQK